MLLHDLILDQSGANADRPALLRDNQRLDYAGLADRVSRVSAGLTRLGVQPGERVGIFLNKRVESVQSYFGTTHAGGVIVPVNPSLKPAQVAHILKDCGVAVLITSATQARGLATVLGECADLRHLVIVGDGNSDLDLPDRLHMLSWNELIAVAPGAPASRIDADIAAIFYTSGSTGKPKGVVLSHRNLVAGAQSVARYLENRSDDVILAVLPLSFDAGFSQLTTAFSVGASVALMDYLLPQDVPRAAARYRATALAGIPPLWIQLARIDWPADSVDNLRYITNTGGTLPISTLTALRENLPDTRVYLMYGLTEAFRSTYLSPSELDARPTSIGKAIPNAEILVVQEDGSPCAPGEPGELVHRGALVSLGYWNDQEGTAARYRPAPGQPSGLPFSEIAVWSGDTVVADEDGFLYFVGRKDDMIKSSGYRISPTEVQEVMDGTGLVNECVVLGIPHFDLGQAVVAVCHTEAPGGATKDALLAACRQTLPNYMIPTEIVFRETLPRNPNGKIDRNRLTSELEDLFRSGAAS